MKKSKTIMAPDGKKTKVNRRFFFARKRAESFIELVKPRLFDFKFNHEVGKFEAVYYRDTKRNRKMFGFEAFIPCGNINDSYWR